MDLTTDSVQLTAPSKPISFLTMFTSPVAVLDSLRERPQSLYPLLFAATYATAVNFYVIQRVGLERIARVALQANSAIDPDAALQNMMTHQSRIMGIQSVATFAGSFAMALVVATILWLLLLVAGREIDFRRVLAVVAHVSMLTMVVKESMLALTATLVRDLDTLDLRNPLATNLAFFVSHATPPVLRILSTLDLITLTNIALIIVGLSRVCDRLTLRTAAVVVIVPWLVYDVAGIAFPFLL